MYTIETHSRNLAITEPLTTLSSPSPSTATAATTTCDSATELPLKDQDISLSIKTRSWSSYQEEQECEPSQDNDGAGQQSFIQPRLKRSKSGQNAPMYRSPVDEDDYHFEMIPFNPDDYDDGCSPYIPTWPSSPTYSSQTSRSTNHSRINSNSSFAAQSVPTPSPSPSPDSDGSLSPLFLTPAALSWYDLPLSCVECAIKGIQCGDADPYLSEYYDGEPPYVPKEYPYHSDAATDIELSDGTNDTDCDRESNLSL